MKLITNKRLKRNRSTYKKSLTKEKIEQKIKLLIKIGKQGTLKGYLERIDLMNGDLFANLPYENLKTSELIYFYKGFFICENYFPHWVGGSVARSHWIFNWITEKLPETEFTETDRKNLWNWALARCRTANLNFNPWSPNNQSKYSRCLNYDDKLMYDQITHKNLNQDYENHKKAIKRKRRIAEIKNKRKTLNEELFKLEIEAFLDLNLWEKKQRFRTLKFNFPINLMPKNEFLALKKTRKFYSPDEIKLFLKRLPKKTMPHVKEYRKELIQKKYLMLLKNNKLKLVK